MSFACRFNAGSSLEAGAGLSVSISPTALTRSASGTSSGSFGPITATASGGTGGYTYSWVVIFNPYGGADPNIISPASAATNVSITGVFGQDTKECTLRCTVTDSSSTTTFADCTVSYFNTDPAP